VPFRSKAQQRLFFAKNPEKARQWAHETKDIKSLPEKKNPQKNPKRKKLKGVKIASEGMFFGQDSSPDGGRFFRDMAGREDGSFLSKQAFGAYPTGTIPQGGGINVGVTGAPMTGMGGGGAGMGTSYGTGNGKRKKPPAVAATKTASPTPADEFDADLSTFPHGFHRPSKTQPEALEHGGERFHSSEARGSDFGTGKGVGSDNRATVKAMANNQMGKHASVTPRRFLGTSATITKEAAPEGYWGQRAGEFGSSLQSAGRQIASKADEGLQTITKSPVAAGLAALVLGRMGLRGLRGSKNLAARGIRRIRQGPPPPPTPAASQIGGLARRVRDYITR
jgi:hypothetical protein